MEGIEAAVAGFKAEIAAGNAGAPLALAALKLHFEHAEALGPLACASFRLNNRYNQPENAEESMRIRQQWVTLTQALLG